MDELLSSDHGDPGSFFVHIYRGEFVIRGVSDLKWVNLLTSLL